MVARAEQFHSRPGMAFVPFHDAPPIDYGLMWPTAKRNPLRRPYIDILEKLATAEAGPTEHL